MSNSVLVFISHASGDKETFIDPLVTDLEDCFINVWIDRKKIIPGNNLRSSIFKEGLNKADVVLIFFTKNSLNSAWVDQEIKHVLREEKKKGNNFDLNKIISIFDCKETYDTICDRYEELTDDLLHLMPPNYTKIQLGQLISAIWSKYFSLQGGDIQIQRQLLEKEKEIFQRDKEIQNLINKIDEINASTSNMKLNDEFILFYESGKLNNFIKMSNKLSSTAIENSEIPDKTAAFSFGLIEPHKKFDGFFVLTTKGKDFIKWLLLENKIQDISE
jgi:hypothetical protein